MNTNRDLQSVATANSSCSPTTFSDPNAMRRPPGSRRERLRSFARTTSQVIRQEISKYYYPENLESDNTLPNSTPNRIMQSSETSSLDQPAPLLRQRTQSMNDLTMSSTQDTVQPHCMLFPTYASKVLEDDQEEFKWKIRLTGWTYAKPGSSRIERWILAAGRTYGGLSANSAEDIHFARLLNQFRAQTIRGVDVQLYIDGLANPDRAKTPPSLPPRPPTITSSIDTKNDIKDNNDTITDITVGTTTITSDKTSNNNNNHRPFGLHHLYDLAQDAIKTIMINSGPTGRFEDLLMMDPAQALQHVGRKMLRLKASFENGIDTPHDGFVDLIEPDGISVISDIDDTIKVTGVLDGRDTILQNTFFRKADEVPGMSEVYQNWSTQGVHVHYVSNSPWQVYPALSEFIRDRHFPAGSMHLRAISTGDLIRKKPGQHKLDVIHQILQDFPDRKFILVGDSGERDPEIYQHIYKQYPNQIIKIFIHDVTSERARHADQRESERSDSYYNGLKRFLAREQPNNVSGNIASGGFVPRRSSTTSTSMLDALGETEIPEEEKVMMDPAVSLKTKLDIFHERMDNLSKDLPEGLLTVFTLASQLRTDPIITNSLATRVKQHRKSTPLSTTASISSPSPLPSPSSHDQPHYASRSTPVQI